MGKAMLLSLGLFIALTCILSLSYEHSSIYVRPTQSSIVFFLISGVWIFLSCVTIPQLFSSSSASSTSEVPDSTLPLRARNSAPTLRDASYRALVTTKTLIQDIKLSFFVSLVTALCVRVEIFRLVLDQQQCKIPGVEGFIPLILAVYDYRQVQGDKQADERLPGNTGRGSWWYGSRQGLGRFILPAVLLSCGNSMTASILAQPRSTYICQHAWYARTIVPAMQVVGVSLDCYLLMSIAILIKFRRTGAAPKPSMVLMIVALLLVASAIVMFIGGFFAFIFHPGYWDWTFAMDAKYMTSLTFHVLIGTLVIVCGFRLLLEYNIVHLAMVIEFFCAYSKSLASALADKGLFSRPTQESIVVSVLLLFLGAIGFLHARSKVEITASFKPMQRQFRIPLPLKVLFILFIMRAYFFFPRNPVIDFHPIDVLIRNGDKQSEAWATQAFTSSTLGEAATEYRRRYHRLPPPGFDKWYKFAVARSSVVIDDYNSLNKDLLPFWALEPKEIRLRTREILSNPWNEVAEITIRGGNVSLGENLVPTHRWMEVGILAMLRNFAHMLPDMDLAFNIHDEARVAIPYERLQKQSGRKNPGMLDENLSNRFSKDRDLSWRNAKVIAAGNFSRINGISRTRTPLLPFEDHSFRGGTNSFYRYGSIACPPSSPARQTHIWNPRTHCTTCASPHSDGLFLSNWTLSACPCHQPDLANLHGFYLSPSSLKNTHDLLPVFSQSKPHGYADILYPSAWNYIDKVLYNATATEDPPFDEKQNTLFWRGATSEGVSRYGNWKGMARQRLVHLANDHTFPTTMLLPHPSMPGKYSYQTIPATDFATLNLSHNIAFVDEITRCWDFDCDVQTSEFGLANQTDFQQHWRYRYLLDMDGAGFSGRFLPFLKSKSLVFKAALFREWYDERLVAWKHFVPLDLRWVGLWSTLAYFSGVSGANAVSKASGTSNGNGGFKPLAPHTAEAEKIASAGRQWANQVLRKEDMEVYMFRLLLEWGRLTEDGREGVGFVG